MKTSVSSYSFSSYMRSSGANQLDIMVLAKEMGFDAIEMTDFDAPDSMTKEEFAQLLREESERLSLPIVNYTVGADLLNAPDLSQEVDRLCAQVRVAEILGAGGMRHDAAGGWRNNFRCYKTFDSALPILAEGCRRVTEYAAERGIVTMVENHGQFCQESTRVEKLVGAVDHSNFGLLVDVGNFLCADEPSVAAVSRVAPFARHVHVKDFHVKSGVEPDPGRGFFGTRGGNRLRGAILGHGNVPVLQCLRILRDHGYDGFVSIEFEGIEENLPALEISLENLKSYLSML
ncbi:MAG: sugar phosphate isomerase/epimerase [Clostridia bacterium]|nr:sugar phosphate isomerase/epimerase [Clostridia bacterium]